MLKNIKQLTLHTSKAIGFSGLFSRSRWRRNRVLILAYHSISQTDEHQWNPELNMTADHFRSRMNILKEFGCNVLPLSDAIKRLTDHDLPEKSVVITFDDGFYNFSAQAYPIIKEYKFPVTLYLTTYYCFYNRPVFDVICSYILWKGRSSNVEGAEFTGKKGRLYLATDKERLAVASAIRAFARNLMLSAKEKDALAANLARHLGVDYEAILAQRILHLLKPDEVAFLAGAGVDIQLHTHRHRVPLERNLFLREIEDNKLAIKDVTGKAASHFCYPSGVYDLEFLAWLKESGVGSATTCDAGIATFDSNQLLLPRLVDTSLLSSIEFEGWLSGISNFLPRRTTNMEPVT